MTQNDAFELRVRNAIEASIATKQSLLKNAELV